MIPLYNISNPQQLHFNNVRNKFKIKSKDIKRDSNSLKAKVAIRTQSTDLLSELIDLFLYDRNFGVKRVKQFRANTYTEK